MIELLVLYVCFTLIYKFFRAGDRHNAERLRQKDLRKTWNNLSPENRAYVVAYYEQMRAEGRI